MGMAPFTVALLLLLLLRVEGIKMGGLIIMSEVMPNAEGNQPFLKDISSGYDTIPTNESQGALPEDVPPPDIVCQSCQEVSRQAEKLLTDPSLYEEANRFSTEVCQIMNSESQIKCRKLVEMYLHEGILLLQIIFLEKNLCNSTGYCPVDNSDHAVSTFHGNGVVPFIEPNFESLGKMGIQLLTGPESKILGRTEHLPLKVDERKSCDACHVATEQICRGLEDQEQQIKIMKSLLKACEILENYANQCKRWVFQFGPLVLANLHKFLSSEDLCLLIHMCEEPTKPDERGGRLYPSMEGSSPLLRHA